MKLSLKISLITIVIIVVFSILLQSISIAIFSNAIHSLNKKLFMDKINKLILLAYEQDELFFEGVYDSEIESKLRVKDKINIEYREQKDPIVFPFIIETNGRIVAHPAYSQWSGRLQDKEEGKQIFDNTTLAFMQKKKEGELEYTSAGVRRWCVFKIYEPWNWIFCITTTIANKNKSINFFIRVALFISIMMIIGSVMVVLFVSRKYIRPIHLVIERLLDIASGKVRPDEQIPINIGTKDEIGMLAYAVNKMSEDLRQTTVSRDELAKEIEERKKMENALKDYAKKIEQINKELDDFTYIVSHDLKEPLRSIDAFSKFLEDDYRDKLNEEGRGYIERIRANSLRMQKLIEDLLEISRIERKRNPLEEVRILDLLNEVKLRLEYAIKEKNVEIIIQDNLPCILCDRVRLMEVFVNLFSNAIKFNDKPNPKIEVGCNVKDDYYEFYVRDNGPGIEEQYYNKIFEIFQRLGRREDHEGTGAGLTIVKKIIEMHKGKIWVESKVGEYTTFYFTIPKRRQAILGKKKIGEILLEKKLITEEDLKQALDAQKEEG